MPKESWKQWSGRALDQVLLGKFPKQETTIMDQIIQELRQGPTTYAMFSISIPLVNESSKEAEERLRKSILNALQTLNAGLVVNLTSPKTPVGSAGSASGEFTSEESESGED